MSDTLDEKGKRGIAVISSMMGEAFGKALAEHATSGGFASAIARMAIDYSFADSWGRDGLARRDRSLLTLGILIALRQTAELKNHVKIGIANGLTAAEIEEVLIHASSYVGFPASRPPPRPRSKHCARSGRHRTPKPPRSAVCCERAE